MKVRNVLILTAKSVNYQKTAHVIIPMLSISTQ